MNFVPRILDIKQKLESKSHFLFGPRQTGKTTLIRKVIPQAPIYNLLDSNTFLQLSRRPRILQEETTQNNQLVVIDEIQRLPQLLNEVHLLIEERGTRFLLTGSSARKLRRKGVNLLGGRARSLVMHPFVYPELEDFDLLRAINVGLLPSIYLSDSPDKDLKAYVGNYLQEEIASEGLTRNIPAFSRFLEVAALCNGTMINYTKISNDAQVARSTVQEYFQILIDTLIASMLPAWKQTKKRKPISTSKFYFFDMGVVRHLRNQSEIRPHSPAFGEAFETYICHEIKSYIDYTEHGTLAFWRSKSGFEVDFILNDNTAIEVKGKDIITQNDMKGLLALQEEKRIKNHVVVCLVDRPRKMKGVQILPWRTFLKKLWNRAFD